MIEFYGVCLMSWSIYFTACEHHDLRCCGESHQFYAWDCFELTTSTSGSVETSLEFSKSSVSPNKLAKVTWLATLLLFARRELPKSVASDDDRLGARVAVHGVLAKRPGNGGSGGTLIATPSASRSVHVQRRGRNIAVEQDPVTSR